MLGKLLSPFTTAAPVGVALRDVVVALGALITLLGILGVLTPEQVKELQRIVEDVSGQWPALMTAFGFLLGAGMSIYRIVFKSSSDKAAEAGKQIDAKLAPEAKVEIVTPGSGPNIVVPGKKT